MAEVKQIEDSNVEKKLINEGVNGTIKWFSVRSGYGFIKREDTNTDIFVHRSSVIRPTDHSGRYFLSVRQGENVKFDVVQGEKGLEASNLTGADGVPLKSGEYSQKFNRGRGRRGQRGANANSNRGDFSDTGHNYVTPRGDGDVHYNGGYTDEPSNFYQRGRGRGRRPRPFSGGMFVRGGQDNMRMRGYGYNAGYNMYPPPMPYHGRPGRRGLYMYNPVGYTSFGPPIMADNIPSFRGGRRGGGYRFRGGGRGKHENSKTEGNNEGPNSESGEDFVNAKENGNIEK